MWNARMFVTAGAPGAARTIAAPDCSTPRRVPDNGSHGAAPTPPGGMPEQEQQGSRHGVHLRLEQDPPSGPHRTHAHATTCNFPPCGSAASVAPRRCADRTPCGHVQPTRIRPRRAATRAKTEDCDERTTVRTQPSDAKQLCAGDAAFPSAPPASCGNRPQGCNDARRALVRAGTPSPYIRVHVKNTPREASPRRRRVGQPRAA